MKRNVLILCDAFPPAFSPRMGYLCKFLSEWGWNPVIVTEYLPQDIYRNLVQTHDITYVNYYWSHNRAVQKLRYALVFLADLFFNYKNWVIKRAAKKKLKKYDISLILSSSHRIFPALAACQLSRQYHIPYLMDLRDIFEQSSHNELISKKITNIKWLNNGIAAVITRKLTRQRNKILKKADIVTTVSTWHVEMLSRYNKQTHLIYNGYDSELFFPETVNSQQFIITYTGRLHSQEIRDPALLFEAVAHLFAQKLIDPALLRIRFYSDAASQNIIRSIAEKHGINSFIDYCKLIPHSEIPHLLNSSSILLLLTNKSSETGGPQGIMTTKLFEYLAVEKPILCVRNDEGCLEATVKSTQSGLAASSVAETACFIMEKYGEWQQKGFTRQVVNRSAIQQFSRRGQARQFVELFEQLTQ
ncbi:MAG: glycosyltransferase [Bacteroidales bacterium]|nr:glycosyltransferase [Bacteroidales bacterium]